MSVVAGAYSTEPESVHSLDHLGDLVVWPELEALIGPRGALAEALPGFERRAGQELMMRAVATAIEQRRVLMVEAGTGIGKSLGYLLPALVSGRRIIVSTGTKALQDQLAERSVPLIRDVLGIPVEVAVLKGRTNYLCRLQLEVAERAPNLALDQYRELRRVKAWAAVSQTGDRAELEAEGDVTPIWRAVAADAEQCVGRVCAHFDTCFLMSARRRAEAANLIIVNHHLFFADLALRESSRFGLIPETDIAVFDEAHHLEDVAALAFGLQVSEARFLRLAADARRMFAKATRDPARVEAPLESLARDVEALWSRLVPLAEGGRSPRLAVERLDEVTQDAYFRVDNSLVALGLVASAEARGEPTVMRIAERTDEIRRELATLFDPSERSYVRWVERGPRATFVRAAPIRVGGALLEKLYPRFEAVVLTSATLATTGGFAHTRDRLGIPEGALELALPSPFDYAAQAICYVPDDMPEPNDPRFVVAACARIEALVGMTRGRALILFTSHGKMLEAWQALRGRWEWPTLVQSEGSKEAVLRRFRETPGAVLFATQTFWEGVDVVGDALSLVVIDKLPFQAPGDPIVDARVAELKAKGRNAFSEYQVPTAILALKQGIGRLIRHRGDRGIAAILDSRLSRARYGRAFLDSLPPARRTADLAELGAWWKELEGNPIQIAEADPMYTPGDVVALEGPAGSDAP